MVALVRRLARQAAREQARRHATVDDARDREQHEAARPWNDSSIAVTCLADDGLRDRRRRADLAADPLRRCLLFERGLRWPKRFPDRCPIPAERGLQAAGPR
jgi:hypothetical protein